MNKKKKKKYLKFIKIIAIFLLLFAIFKGVFLLVLLIGLSFAISFLVNNFPIRNLGIELVTFIAVLTGWKYGPWPALLVTFILISYHMIAGGFLGSYVLWVIPAYCVAAIISGFLPQIDITLLGILITIGINLNNIFFTAITSPSYLPKYMIFVVTNILFNILLFTTMVKPVFFFI